MKTKNRCVSNIYYSTAVICLVFSLISVSMNVNSDSMPANPVLMLLEEMKAQSPAIKAYQFRIQSAEQEYEDAQWQRFPTPRVGFNSSSNNESLVRFSLDQPIWSGGRINHSINIEKSKIEIANAEKNVIELDMATELVNALGEWVAAYLKKDAYLNSKLIYEELEETIKRRAASGVSSDVDVLLIGSRRRVLDNDILKEENNLIVKSQILSSLLGRMISVNDLDVYGFSNPLGVLPVSELPAIDDLYNLVLDHPRVNNLKAQIATKEIEVKKAKSNIWPSVSLELRHDVADNNRGVSNSDTSVFLNINTDWSPGISTLTSHNKVQSALYATQSDKEAQIQTLMRLYINDYLLYEATLSQIENTIQSINSARLVYDSYKRQYLVGNKSWIELLNAAQDIINYQIQLSEYYSVKFITRWRLEMLISKY